TMMSWQFDWIVVDQLFPDWLGGINSARTRPKRLNGGVLRTSEHGPRRRTRGVRYPAASKEYQHETLVNDAAPAARSTGRKFRAFTAKHLDELTARAGLTPEQRLATRAVATVLPFRTNAYVIEELIDWSAAPDDPIYRLVFPQEDMLPP